MVGLARFYIGLKCGRHENTTVLVHMFTDSALLLTPEIQILKCNPEQHSRPTTNSNKTLLMHFPCLPFNHTLAVSDVFIKCSERIFALFLIS